MVEETFFSPQDLADILTGSVFLASGGGGAVKTGEQMLKQILDFTDKVAYIAPEDVADSATMPVMAGLGSPDALEKMGFDYAPLRAFELLEKEKGLGKFNHIVPVETGTVAHFASLWVAAKNGISVVDGDGGGRAFPTFPLCTFAANNLPIAPVVLTTEIPVLPNARISHKKFDLTGAELILKAKNPATMDNLGRAFVSTPEVGGIAACTSFAMQGEEMKKAIVSKTLTRAKNLGCYIREVIDQAKDIVPAVIDFFMSQEVFAKLLLAGKVTSVNSETTGGFDFGKVIIEGLEGETGYVITQNESLIAWSNKYHQPLAMGPDLICYLTNDGKTLSNTELEEGLEINVIGVQAPSQLRTPYFFSQYGEILQRLGYYGPYIPIESLHDAGGK